MSSNKHKTLIRDNTFYYWLGFILADGHVSNGRLIVQLHDNDLAHLQKLSNYLSIYKIATVKDKYRHHSRLSYMNKELFDSICEDFNISSQKTQNPPNILYYDKLSNDELLSVFTGFVDGDGSIGNLSKRKDFHLRIKCHSSWNDFITYLNNRLNLKGNCKINKEGYLTYSITNTKVLKDLKICVLKLNIPILNRKWDRIDFNYIGRNELAEIRKKIVKDSLDKGLMIKDIALLLNVKSSTISQIIKRNDY